LFNLTKSALSEIDKVLFSFKFPRMFIITQEELLVDKQYIINQIPFGTINQVELGIIYDISLN
jgi:hypothetical protein